MKFFTDYGVDFHQRQTKLLGKSIKSGNRCAFVQRMRRALRDNALTLNDMLDSKNSAKEFDKNEWNQYYELMDEQQSLSYILSKEND